MDATQVPVGYNGGYSPGYRPPTPGAQQNYSPSYGRAATPGAGSMTTTFEAFGILPPPSVSPTWERGVQPAAYTSIRMRSDPHPRLREREWPPTVAGFRGVTGSAEMERSTSESYLMGLDGGGKGGGGALGVHSFSAPTISSVVFCESSDKELDRSIVCDTHGEYIRWHGGQSTCDRRRLEGVSSHSGDGAGGARDDDGGRACAAWESRHGRTVGRHGAGGYARGRPQAGRAGGAGGEAAELALRGPACCATRRVRSTAGRWHGTCGVGTSWRGEGADAEADVELSLRELFG